MSTEARDRMMVEFANTHNGDPAVQRAAFNYGWGGGWDARGQVTPDREAIATILGIRYNDDRPGVDEPSIHDLEVAAAILALFEKGNE